MNKITKKLFLYFACVSVVLAGTIFVGFYGVFRHYSFQHQEEELQVRAEVIKERIEYFMNNCTDHQEVSAYIKVLDDISLADAYFIPKDGKEFTCTCSCNSTIAIDKKPTAEAEEFANVVYEQGKYIYLHEEENGLRNDTRIYVGIPVREGDETVAAIVIVDTLDIDRGSFWLAIAILGGCLILALLLAGILSSVLAKRFMVPITKIADTTQALASGNYQVKTNVPDQNEIGDLANKIDFLAEKLDLAEKERARMEQIQKDYITNISHELRTPVTVIRSSMEALNDKMVAPEKVSDYQKQVLKETIALQRLVNDMLELSRLENQDFPIEKEEIDIHFVLEDAVRTTRTLAEQKGIQVHCQMELDEWLCRGDYGRLRQMFMAVLDNAVKYSEEGTNIWIETFRQRSSYCIAIRDEGCGMEQEEMPYVFDKFYRASKKSISGTGLGMAIAKSIADRHHIDIQLESAIDQGTTVTFIVPAYI